MKKLFLCLFISFTLLGTSILYANKIELIKKSENVYLLEFKDYTKKENCSITLKKIAKKVKEKGFNYFLYPNDLSVWGNTTVYIVVSNDDSLSDLVSDAYNYSKWNADYILENK